jgi:hypothetical protein
MQRFADQLKSIPGGVGDAEIDERLAWLEQRLRGKVVPLPPQSGGGHIPKDLAKEAKRVLFSKTGAFPLRGGHVGGLAPSTVVSALPAVAAALPTMESFLKSQGIPNIPITVKRTPGDFLGDGARWWIKVASSPYLGVLVKLTFMVMFFLSYLEATPIIGSVLSAALDLTLSGGRIVVKALQKGIPPLVGLIPIPYAQFVGVALVSVVGLFVWTILATISFSRQDFTSAIESMLRIMPMPIGDALADSFLDANRTLDQLSQRKNKLTSDVMSGLTTVQGLITQLGSTFDSSSSDAFNRVKSGTDLLLNAARTLSEKAVPTATPVAPAPSAPPAEAPVAQEAPPAPVPEPVAQEAPPPPAAPAPAPAPEAPAPPPPAAPTPEPKTPETPMSALERLRGQKTNVNVGKGFRGGKTLSTKRREARKWTIRQLSARFSGAGLR